MQTNTHILVIRLSAMGDVAMTIPVIRALVAQYPEIKITFLSKSFLKPLFDDIPNVHFYAADVTNTHKGILGLHKLYKELKQLNITHIADVHNVLRSKILRSFFKFSTNKIAVINKGRSEKKALTRVTNKVFKQLKTSHERSADVFRKLDFPVDISSPTKLEKPNLKNSVLNLIGEKKNKWLGIAPFAAYDAKMYPLDLMEKVITELSKNYTILLFGGGEKEVALLSKIEEKFPNCISLAGKLNLSEELNAIAHLDCMLAMDSGNAHFAAMLQIPTITLWGATHPFAGFAPFNQPKENCMLPNLEKYPNIPCSIYGNKICDGYEDVMRTILPENVIKKIETILN
ncbi:glycosyltransferase family 9 protein [Polaribacter gochangensis]|uniref:glycosyltransferase family 9 protein n=1 Tax=Polaribacter gochangensis TaxID=3252903 RepID=UPI0039049273